MDHLSASRISRLEPLEDRLLLATLALNPVKDNTLIQTTAGDLSNGAGEIFAGRTGGLGGLTLRRGLIAFDLSSIPAGATITSASLEMTMSKVGPGALNDNMRIHRLTRDWGEGASFNATGRGAGAAANEATWTDNFFGASTWTTPGGDFVGSPSVSAVVPFAGTANWSGGGLVTDVQAWHASPATNFGWIIIGDEATPEASNRNVRRFNSKEVGSNKPTLTVEFTEPATLTLAIAADAISEAAGSAATTVTVTRSGDTSSALVVNLASSDTSEATVQPTVTIAAGQTVSPTFNLDAVDDSTVDGTQTVTITASGTGFPDATDTVDVTDDDVAALQLTIAAGSISEAGGAGATTATVSRNTDTTNALVVHLTSSDTSEAVVQSTVTIPAGQATSSPFNLDAVDDSIVDGTQTVTVTGSAAGFADGSDTVDVTDDDRSATVTGQILNEGSPNRSGLGSLTYQFSEAKTLGTASVLDIWNHTTSSAVDLSGASLVNDGTTSVTFDLTGVTFPRGNYTAKLAKTAAGLAATHTFSFHIQPGDSNGDGQVGFPDFGDLAAAFNTLGGPRYGPGDMDGDTNVSFSDFGLLAEHFNAILAPPELDFGDASESGTTFATTLPQGAHHILGSGLLLGATVDSEADGQPDASATGDGADEDGVAISTLVAGTNAPVAVTATVPAAAVLNGWIDFSRDGDWDDPGEHVFIDQPVSNGLNSLAVAVPAGASPGTAFARFRITSCAGHSHEGLARDGEVEDYLVTIASSSASRLAPGPAGLIDSWAAPAVDPTTVEQAAVKPARPDRLWEVRTVDQAISELAPEQSMQPGPRGSSLRPERLADQVFELETNLLPTSLLDE